MNLVELDRALRQLRLGGIVAVLESRLLQAQTEHMAPIDLISVLVSDELRRRADSLLERRTKHASFRESDRALDNFDFDFNKKMNRRLIYELAAGHFVAKPSTRTRFSPARPAPARAISPRRSAAARSSNVTASSIARPTH
jgi:DNA replication protein DnaC